MTKRLMLFVFAFLSIALAAQNVLAESDLGFKAIGGRLGYVDPESEYKGTFTLGAVADFGTIIPQLHWDAALTYWSSSLDWGWAGSNYEVSLTDIALRTGVKYYFIEGEWQPYGGGGLGMHFFSSEAEGPHGSYWTGADDSELEFYLVGGVQHPLSEKLVGSAELQLDIGDVDQTTIQINLMYLLGK